MNNIKILIVSSSLTMRRIIINALQSIGYKSVIEAEGDLETLKKLESEKIELVVFDIQIPIIYEITLIKKIRMSNKFGEVPILLVVSYASRDQIIEGWEVKMNDYIIKPFLPISLQEKIEKILGNTRTA